MNRLDWVALWSRYDAEVDKIRESTGAYLYTYHVTAQARGLLQEIVESALADREAALQQ